MPSQTDLDQGGSYRQWVRRFLGPSVGWVWVPQDNVVNVIAGGTTSLVVGVTLVTVSFNGSVTIQLPSSKASTTATAGALPGKALLLPVTVVDIGGFAAANPVTILPFGTEQIDGLASVQLANAFGSLTFNPPNLTSGGWTI